MQQDVSRNQSAIKLPEPDFSSAQKYRAYCNGLASAYRDLKASAPATPTFGKHLAAIAAGDEMVIKTDWGGVDIVSYHHPQVEKFLVVESGKFLAFEKHDEKVETLIGEEGLGVLVYRPDGGGDLKAEFIQPGWTRTLQPGQEHTIIALSNLLVRERSTDPKGMDKDLIFIYMPTGE